MFLGGALWLLEGRWDFKRLEGGGSRRRTSQDTAAREEQAWLRSLLRPTGKEALGVPGGRPPSPPLCGLMAPHSSGSLRSGSQAFGARPPSFSPSIAAVVLSCPVPHWPLSLPARLTLSSCPFRAALETEGNSDPPFGELESCSDAPDRGLLPFTALAFLLSPTLDFYTPETSCPSPVSLPRL